MWGLSLLIITALCSFLPASDSGALSVFEQMKYKTLTDDKGLYSSKDDVFILRADNFNGEIYNNKRAWLVEFYNSWCGHCQHFAPVWKNLASELKPWRDLVGIAAINCADDANNRVCREFEIMAYPTLKYFHEYYKEEPSNLGAKMNSEVEDHKRQLVEKIMQEQKEGRGKIYPDLTPYTHHDLSHIFKETKRKHALLFIQEPANLTAQEIALDIHKADVIVRYALTNNTHLVDLLKPKKYPALYVVDKDFGFKLLGNEGGKKGEFVAIVQTFLNLKDVLVPEKQDGKINGWKEADMTSFMHERERVALKNRVKKMGDVVFQMDLETALRYSLKHEVGNIKHITGEQLTALRNYLKVLTKFFPFGQYGRIFLNELYNFVKLKTTVDGQDIAMMLTNAELDDRQVFSSKPDWLGCKGSTPNYRGYPCGLWKLFHYLTVNAADHAVGNPKIILEAMHGYIKNFFGCVECSQHFQEMAKRRDIFGVKSWDDSILWLWMAHNEVNKRLSGDVTEDVEYPKEQFPNKNNCPVCYNKDSSWNIPEVLHYLKQVYNSINVRYIGSDTRILHLGLDGSIDIFSESTFFKKIDTALCLILYVASFMLIIILIRMFLRRGYRKKAYYNSLLGKV